MTPSRDIEDRILVLTPTGRDAALAQRILEEAGLPAVPVADMNALCDALEKGACAALIAEEAITLEGLRRLQSIVARQPQWSDLPFVVFTSRREGDNLELIRAVLPNVLFIDRPLRIVTLVSALRGVVRARQRQYELRTLLERRDEDVARRDQFLAMLGHELRNPLAAIQMASDMMARDGSEAFSKQRSLISRQTRNLSQLVDELLDVARVTTGKIVLRRTNVDLGELVHRTVQALEENIGVRRQTVSVAADDDPVTVFADPLRLEQIVSNLLTNATKYTPEGGRIEVRVHRADGKGVLRVKDTGVGIAPKMLPRIFDLFVQADSALDRSRGGLGIGLTVVRSLVQQHQGTIEASSEGIGRGSEFVVRIPLSDAMETDEEAAVESPAPRRRVVVVEDQADLREVIEDALSALGHDVAVACDGLQGVDLIIRTKPEIALIDIGLPGIDGFNVARRVRARLGRQIYLVAFSGYAQPDDEKRAFEMGFDLHLSKPVPLERLKTILAHQQP